MYESFFGLTGLPFKITPDERVFFGGGQRQSMLDALVYNVQRGEGLITVTGEVGTGKTTLVRVLVKQLSDRVQFVSIYTPNVQPLDMLYLLVSELGLSIPPHQPMYVLLDALRSYFLEQIRQDKQVVVLVDEAQTMPVETLEQLRLLSNWQTEDFKLVQIILFGQPELDAMLSHASVRQIKDRIVYQLQLMPFSEQDVAAYLEFRMRQVGYRGERMFSPEVVAAIYEQTKGFPRAVNKLADQVLMAAFADQSPVASMQHMMVPVKAARIHFVDKVKPSVTHSIHDMLGRVRDGASPQWLIALFSFLMFALVLGYWLFHSPVEEKAIEADAVQQTEPSLSVQGEAAVNASTLDVTHQQGESASVVGNTMSMGTSAAGARLPDKRLLGGQETQSDKTESMVSAASVEPKITKPSRDWARAHENTLQQMHQHALQKQYTIQVMSDPWRLREDFAQLSKSVLRKLPDNAHFFADYVLSDGRPRIALLYGVYNSYEEASEALQAVKLVTEQFQPVVIPFRQISNQMQQSTAVTSE